MNLERNKAIYKAHTCFQLFGWTWASKDGDYEPSLNDIEERLIDLEKSAKEIKGWAGTGRLTVHYFEDDGYEWFDYHLDI